MEHCVARDQVAGRAGQSSILGSRLFQMPAKAVLVGPSQGLLQLPDAEVAGDDLAVGIGVLQCLVN